jgi:hypothetical protein
MGYRALAIMGWIAFFSSINLANARTAQVSGDLESCELRQTLELTGDLYIECVKDLVIGKNVKIITHGYALTIFVSGILQLPSIQDGGLKIIDGKSQNSVGNSVSDYIIIEATTAIGGLYVASQAQPTEAAVELNFMTVYNFEQAIYSMNTLMILDGKEIALKGPRNSLP